jgi:RNA processing factor Prp31
MFKKIYENFRNGMEKIRWFATLFSERINIEVAIFKLLYQSDEMARKRKTLLNTIGERVVELKGQSEKNIFRDSVVVVALEEIDQIDKHINELRHKAGEISRVTG